MAGMEESLAREMAKLKITDERSMREAEMVFAASDELNELKARIQHAKLNKERSAQIAEAQYREQIEIVTTLLIEFSLENFRCFYRSFHINAKSFCRNTMPRSTCTIFVARRLRIKCNVSATRRSLMTCVLIKLIFSLKLTRQKN